MFRSLWEKWNTSPLPFPRCTRGKVSQLMFRSGSLVNGWQTTMTRCTSAVCWTAWPSISTSWPINQKSPKMLQMLIYIRVKLFIIINYFHTMRPVQVKAFHNHRILLIQWDLHVCNLRLFIISRFFRYLPDLCNLKFFITIRLFWYIYSETFAI